MKFLNHLTKKYAGAKAETQAKAPEETPLSKALRRYVVQALKCEIPLYHAPHALYEAITSIDPEEAKEHHDNLKKMMNLLKDVEECLDKAQKAVQQQHAGAVLQKSKNYL